MIKFDTTERTDMPDTDTILHALHPDVLAAASAGDTFRQWDLLVEATKSAATPQAKILASLAFSSSWAVPYDLEKLGWDDDTCYRHIAAMERRAIVHDDPGCLDSADFAADVLRMRGHDVPDVYGVLKSSTLADYYR